MRKIFLWVLALLAVYGCSKMEPVSGVAADESGETPIELHGVINPTGTRADGVISGESPSQDLDIIVLRANANSAVADDYPTAYSADYPAIWQSIDGEIVWDNVKVNYPKNGWKTRLIGLYPRGTRTDNVVTIPFDGYADVMCSQIVEGDIDTPAGDFTFNHLLTQVQVYVKGEDVATFDEWGAITSLQLVGRSGNLTVTLPAPNSTSASPSVSVTGSDDTEVPKYDGTSTYTTNKTFTATEQQYGLIMFPPATGVLSFTVTTVYNTTPVTVTTSTLQAFSAAQAYKITIEFKAGGQISIGAGSVGTTSNMSEWQSAGGSQEETVEADD